MRSIFATVLAVVVMSGIVWGGPQYTADPKSAPPAAAPQQEKALQTTAGELTRVDAQKQLFWIKTPAGEEMQFSYTKDTPVSGAGKSAEGLNDLGGRGTEIKVQYETKGGTHFAVKIEIQAQSS